MSSVSDFLSFLSNGTPPQNVPSYNQVSNQLPPWYNDYTQQILNKTAQSANEPYAPYPGPRVAPVSQPTQQAWEMAQQAFPQSQQYFQQAAKMLTPGALGGAAPYLSGGFPANASNYMSPYTSGVVDEIGRLGMENFNEQLLPGLQDEFVRTGGGGYGLNTREGDMAVRLGRDVNRNILGAQAGALESGYKTAADIYQGDVSGNTAAAGVMGGLGGQSANAATNGVGALTDIGKIYQGTTQASLDTGYADFLRQQQYPYLQAQNMANILPNIKVPTGTETYTYGPASMYGASPLAQVGSLGLTAGALSELFGRQQPGTTGPGGTSSGTDISSLLSWLASQGGGTTGGGTTGGTGSADWQNMLDPNYNWLTG